MIFDYNDYNNNSLLENVADAKKWLEKNKIPTNTNSFIVIRNMLQNNPNLTLMFTKFHFGEEKVELGELEELYDKIKDSKDIIGGLPKKLIEYDNAEELSDNLRDLNIKQTFKKFGDELPSNLKEDLKKLPKDKIDKFIQVTKEFYTNPKMNKEVRKNFTKTISRYKTIDSLIEAFTRFVSNSTSDFTYDEVMEKINKTKGVEVKYTNEDHDVLLIKIYTYQAAQALCSITSWCIKDSEYRWKEYVGDKDVYNVQYVIFNFNVPYFDNYSMIGFTMREDKSIKTAHLKDDTYISSEQLYRYLKSLGVPLKILVGMGKREKITKVKYYEMVDKLENTKGTKAPYFKNRSALSLARQLVDTISENPAFSVTVEDNIIPLIAIVNDDVELFKRIVDLGYDVNTTNRMKLQQEFYDRKTPKVIAYDVALLKNATNIINYLNEIGAKKFDTDTDTGSYYLAKMIKEKSDDEVKVIIRDILKSMTDDSKKDEDETEISLYDDEKDSKTGLFEFIFENKTVEYLKYCFELLPEDLKYKETNSLIRHMGWGTNYDKDKIDYLLELSNNMATKNYMDKNNFFVMNINTLLSNCISNKHLDLLKKYTSLIKFFIEKQTSYSDTRGFKPDTIMNFEPDRRHDVSDWDKKEISECIYYLFNLGMIPLSNEISKVTEFITFLGKRKSKIEDIKKYISSERFQNLNVDVPSLFESCIENDKIFFDLIQCGLPITAKDNSNKNLLENILHSMYGGSWSRYKVDKIKPKIFDYVIKNNKLENKELYDNNFKFLIQAIDSKNFPTLMDYVINEYDDIPNLIDKDKYHIHSIYSTIIHNLMSINKDNTIQVLINKAKAKGITIHYKYEEFIKTKDRASITKYHNMGLEFDKRTIKLAVDTNDLEFVKFIFDSGYKIDPKDVNTMPDLSDVMKSENMPMLTYLVDKGCKPESSWSFQYATETGNIEMVKYILSKKLYNFSKDTWNETRYDEGITTAIKAGKMEMVQYLYNRKKYNVEEIQTKQSSSISRGYREDENNFILASIKTEKGNLNFVKFFLSKGFKIMDNYDKFIYNRNDLTLIKYLVDNKYFTLKPEHLKLVKSEKLLQYLIDNNVRIDETMDDKLKQDILRELVKKATNGAVNLFLSKFKDVYSEHVNLLNRSSLPRENRWNSATSLKSLVTELIESTSDRHYNDNKDLNKNVVSVINTYENLLNIQYIYDDVKRQRISTYVRETLKDMIAAAKKGKPKNEDKKQDKNMKYIKLFEEYYDTATEKETEVRPTTKPRISPIVDPTKPPAPVILPNPKNMDEELKKIVNRYNRLKKK